VLVANVKENLPIIYLGGFGIKVGEMEKDCMISHGASAFLKERLLDQSDSYTTCVCKLCGMTAIQDVLNNTSYCKGCKTSDVAEVTIPYAYKLLAQELQAANIVARMNVE